MAFHAAMYQPLNSTTDGGITWFDTITGPSNGIKSRANNLVQPNASWGYNEALVTINFDYNNFKNVVTDKTPTLNDILFYSTKTYQNKGMVDDDLGTFLGDSTVNSTSPYMTIEAGVDLFASVKSFGSV